VIETAIFHGRASLRKEAVCLLHFDVGNINRADCDGGNLTEENATAYEATPILVDGE